MPANSNTSSSDTPNPLASLVQEPSTSPLASPSKLLLEKFHDLDAKFFTLSIGFSNMNKLAATLAHRLRSFYSEMARYDEDKAQKKLEELEREFSGVIGAMKRTVQYFSQMQEEDEAMGKEERVGGKNRVNQRNDERWRQEDEEEVPWFDNLDIRGSDTPWGPEQADIQEPAKKVAMFPTHGVKAWKTPMSALTSREKREAERDACRFRYISEPKPALSKGVRAEWEEERGYGSDDDSVGAQD